MLYSAIPKYPGTRLDYTITWTDELGGDTISTSTFPDFPTSEDLDLVSSSFNNAVEKTVSFRLEGGTHGREYQFTNHVVGTSGQIYDWDIAVFVSHPRTLSLTGPPYASIQDAQAFNPGAEGAEPLKVETTLYQASDIVARLAPKPAPPLEPPTLRLSMDATQTTIPVDKVEDFQPTGVVKIGSEVLSYSAKQASDPFFPLLGEGSLVGVARARYATLPTTHASDAVIEDVDYHLKAKRAELLVFEWLWNTGGYKPSRTGVIGSENYNIELSQIRGVIRMAMGRHYMGGGQSVAVKPRYPRSYRARYTYPDWLPK